MVSCFLVLQSLLVLCVAEFSLCIESLVRTKEAEPRCYSCNSLSLISEISSASFL